MIGSAYIFGICVATAEWLNVATFTLLVWIFIPFLLAARVFTIPEFLERRFNSTLRQFFALATIVSNVVAFLAAVLYGGGLALHHLFGWGLWPSIIALGVVAGSWAIYGGLRAVAWTDLFTVAVMIAGGLMVTILGLRALGGDSGSVVDGFGVMIERNRATAGVWQEVVEKNAPFMSGEGAAAYDRLSVVQPVTHEVVPWPSLIFALFTVSIWYHVLNQTMIQRVLGARNEYHARMGIVFAGFLKILMPAIVVLPGLILFALRPEIQRLPWGDIQPEADKAYVSLLQTLVPAGLRGLFLAALFGAIQSTVNSVLNSTATVFTLDFYKRYLFPRASEKSVVRVGMASSVAILAVAIAMAGWIPAFGKGLFVYIQSLYYFFGPPFSAVFILGILSRRINAKGATVAVFAGFALGILMKAYVALPGHPAWLEPYAMQAIVNWAFCIVACAAVSALTPPPAPEQVTDQLTLDWRRLNIFGGLGDRWYTGVVLWWSLFAALGAGVLILFSGIFL
jgi:solute:Na+ symporter, SSS family